MRKSRLILTVALVFFVLFGAGTAMAAEKVDFILNWIAGGDHAPYYYAHQQGWYKDAGIDLDIQQGKGSSMAAQRTGVGKNPLVWLIWVLH